MNREYQRTSAKETLRHCMRVPQCESKSIGGIRELCILSIVKFIAEDLLRASRHILITHSNKQHRRRHHQHNKLRRRRGDGEGRSTVGGAGVPALPLGSLGGLVRLDEDLLGCIPLIYLHDGGLAPAKQDRNVVT